MGCSGSWISGEAKHRQSSLCGKWRIRGSIFHPRRIIRPINGADDFDRKDDFMKTISLRRSAAAFAVLTLLGVWGCTDRPTIFDNPDPNLRLSSSELRGDALGRFPYKEDAPKAREIRARAQVAYPLN